MERFVRAAALRTVSLVRPFKRRVVMLLIGGALLGVGTLGMSGVYADTGTASCTPNTAYGLPGPLDLTHSPAGVTIVSDPTAYYTVRGTTRADIAAGLNACAPSFDGIRTDTTYLAYTGYTLNWRYDMTSDGTTCRLTNVKVGLHVSRIYPQLDTTGVPGPLIQKWQAFMAGLSEHEDGHAAIDTARAEDLASRLKVLSGSYCADVLTRAAALTSEQPTIFETANHDHDTDTDYGRSQGATW